MFSRRSGFELSHNRVTVALARARANGAEPLDLTLSNPTLAGIPYAPGVADALVRSADTLRYDPAPFGLESARAAVAALWGERGIQVSPERVALTASTSEAYSFLFKLFCYLGDEVLVPAPSYPLFEHLAALEGVRPVPYRLGYDGAWFVDAAAVARAVTERTRALVAVSPNNPTGSFLKSDELARLGALGVPIVSDEVFGEYALAQGSARERSVLAHAGSLVVALDGLSKLAALPQLKLAWMTWGGPEREVARALERLEIIADAFLSPSTPVQRALPGLLASRGVAQNALRARLRSNLARLSAACADTAVTALPVEGGWYAVLRLPATRSDEDWALALIEQGVVVQPGYFFDFGETPHVVVSLITPESVLSEGIARLVRCASAL